MQSSDLRYGDDLSMLGWFDLAFNRRVAIQRQVSSRFVLIVEVIDKNPPQVSLVEHDEVVEALATDRSDELLDVRRLP